MDARIFLYSQRTHPPISTAMPHMSSHTGATSPDHWILHTAIGGQNHPRPFHCGKKGEIWGTYLLTVYYTENKESQNIHGLKK